MLWLCYLLALPVLEGTLRCSQIHYPAPSYYQLKQCYKSEMTVLAYGYQRTLSKCSDYAAQKRGLAFNFMAGDNKLVDEVDELEEYSCQVLSCPEIENSTSLVNDSRYDYYSFYTDPLRLP